MTTALIVAAGRGTRMGPKSDKLFLEVAGRPVIAHTWQRFEEAACIDQLVLVTRQERLPVFHELARQFGFRKPFVLVAGGPERQDSVWNGLQALRPETEIVAIHDGARPCTSQTLITATVDAARQVGAAVAAQRVTDTIKESDDGVCIARTIDRRRLWAVQTPQCFRVDIIRRALAVARERAMQFTDDTAACELIGQPVKLVESLEPNPKLTSPADVAYVRTLLERGPDGS